MELKEIWKEHKDLHLVSGKTSQLQVLFLTKEEEDGYCCQLGEAQPR